VRLSEIAKVIGDVPTRLEHIEPEGYGIDSRTVQTGELFFAVKGEKFDGHDFVPAALAQGAVAAVVAQDRKFDQSLEDRLIKTDEPLKALQDLASDLLRRWNRPIIGITGSAGKTTTKELTALVLSAKGRILKSTGNLNNAFGLPLSVLRMESKGARSSDFDYAVLEMGMSSPGEIRRLCEIAPPDVGAILNVSAAHLEFFGSLEAIANAKAEIVEGLKPGGLAVLNADDRLVRQIRDRHSGPALMFGIEGQSDVRAVDVREMGLLGTSFRLVTPSGEAEAHLPLAGRHILYNALIAAAVGHHFGLSPEEIAAQLKEARPASHRGEVLRFRERFLIVDDSYNSNPRALDEMVRMLGAVVGSDIYVKRRIVVAGEMLELGDAGPELHRKCGENIAGGSVDLLVGVRGLARDIVEGARAAGMTEEKTHFCENSEEAAGWLVDRIEAGDLLLIKGSRGVKTDLIVEAIKQRFEMEGA
jgi:UDP-N-acetylmuramoyl-tripeptide--D-alanyl-D-alanine ligase